MSSEPNLRQAVPFFAVLNMEKSLRFHVDGLGFEMADKWEDDGTVRWCRLVRAGTALMLQDFRRDGGKTWSPDLPLGLGLSIMFICSDALSIYRELAARGLMLSPLRRQRNVGHVAARSRRLPHRVRESDGCPGGQHFQRQGDGCHGLATACSGHTPRCR